MLLSPWVRGICLVVLSGLFYSQMASAQEQRPLNLMPAPASVQSGAGQLAVDASFSVAMTGHDDARLERAVRRFLRQLGRQS
jgi:hexosaminidase